MTWFHWESSLFDQFLAQKSNEQLALIILAIHEFPNPMGTKLNITLSLYVSSFSQCGQREKESLDQSRRCTLVIDGALIFSSVGFIIRSKFFSYRISFSFLLFLFVLIYFFLQVTILIIFISFLFLFSTIFTLYNYIICSLLLFTLLFSLFHPSRFLSFPYVKSSFLLTSFFFSVILPYMFPCVYSFFLPFVHFLHTFILCSFLFPSSFRSCSL